jgi:hypothetical protein
MFVDSCLYPFSISLLAVLWLFINNTLLSQTITRNLNSHSTSSMIMSLKQQNSAIVNFAMFIIALWVYASFLSPKGAGDSGLIWIVASSYDTFASIKHPNHKRWGYVVSLFVIVGLW